VDKFCYLGDMLSVDGDDDELDGKQNLSHNSIFALTPTSTLVHPVLVAGFMQPLQTCFNHFVHATRYTITFPVYPLLTISTLGHFIFG